MVLSYRRIVGGLRSSMKIIKYYIMIPREGFSNFCFVWIRDRDDVVVFANAAVTVTSSCSVVPRCV